MLANTSIVKELQNWCNSQKLLQYTWIVYTYYNVYYIKTRMSISKNLDFISWFSILYQRKIQNG